MMSKIQNLNGTHNTIRTTKTILMLFMMSKIQNLNGTHNTKPYDISFTLVVYDVKDTKIVSNS